MTAASDTRSNNKADIVIIGGGVAGCTVAIALAGSYTVMLIDKLAAPVARIGECLPPAARRIFRRLGLQEELDGAGALPALKSMGIQSYWGSDRVQIADHLRNPDGFGWHLDRQAFEVYLREIAIQRGVQQGWPAKLYSAHYDKERWYIRAVDDSAGPDALRHPIEVEAKFVIDASGRQSHFARKAGVERSSQDKLISCWGVLPDSEQNKLSTISACADGWWYTSALPNNRRVLAFQTDADLVDRTALKTTAGFLDLAHANPQIMGLLERTDGIIDYQGTVAANSTCLNQVAGRQWVALGDAAMSFDPLSSQGMYNAMAGAMQLSDLICDTGLLADAGFKNLELFNATYTSQMNAIWQHYLRHKDLFYRQERRWVDKVFWERRV